MRLTAEALFAGVRLDGAVPMQPTFAPDGSCVTFLAARDDRQRQDLYRCDLRTGEIERIVDARDLDASQAPITDEEKAQQERRRSFTTGIGAHMWHPDGGSILFTADGNAYLLDAATLHLHRVTPEGTRQSDVRFSGAGRYVAYVRAGDLFVYDLDRKDERRLTHDASDTISNGVAEFVAQEEMHRYEGYWFSNDDRCIAYARVDQSPIALTYRYEIEADRFDIFAQRYPFAGAPNAKVRLMLVELTSGTRREVPYHDADDDYLARVTFGDEVLCAQVQSRDQRRLRVKTFALGDLSMNVRIEETASTWINLHDNLRFLPGTKDFVWTSQRDGDSHLYLCRAGDEPVQLTAGSGRVNQVHHVASDHVSFTGWFDRPVEQHGYRVAFDRPKELQALTTEPGWHELEFAPDGKGFVDRASTLTRPVDLVVGRVDREERRRLGSNRLDADHPYSPFLDAHCPAELGCIDQAGVTLWYRLTRPRTFDTTRRYPVIVHVYGGPGIQRVRNEWAPLQLQLLAQHGFIVFELDNRGSGNRSKSFEDPIHGQLGRIEVEDQLHGVAFLRRQPWVDPARIAVYGHSYGGYMALMCLCKASDVFRAGIAVAPVTDWSLYDTHYTERYLRTPDGNPAGYAGSAVSTHLAGLRSALLVMHGMADDNVLFTHSTKLFKALQDRHLRFEMMTYPGAKHSLQEPDAAIHRFRTILDFLERTVGAGAT
jgi:dipeptidyl-peptidase 4